MTNLPRQTHRRSRRAALLMASVLVAACTFAAQASAETRNDIMAYGAVYGVSDGFDDRVFGGVNVDLVRDKTTYHGEISSIDREESATYAAVGATWQAGENLRASANVGTSTDNDNILPDIYLSGGLTFVAKEKGDWAVTPSVTYRHYRSEDWETSLAVEGVKYTEFSADKGGYYVIQLRGSVAPNSSDEVGYSAGGSITTERANGLSLGIGLEVGHSAYDVQQGIAVRTDYVAIRPTVGFHLSERTEIFARGEFADLDTYDIQGVMLGIKTQF